MPLKTPAEKKNSVSKKQILEEITRQLSQALAGMKESMGEKKFDKRIKKAARLFSEGVKSSKPANSQAANPEVKPPAKKRGRPAKSTNSIPAPRKTAKVAKKAAK